MIATYPHAGPAVSFLRMLEMAIFEVSLAECAVTIKINTVIKSYSTIAEKVNDQHN